jgi:hypothetical protein
VKLIAGFLKIRPCNLKLETWNLLKAGTPVTGYRVQFQRAKLIAGFLKIRPCNLKLETWNLLNGIIRIFAEDQGLIINKP